MKIWKLAKNNSYAIAAKQIVNALKVQHWLQDNTTAKRKWFTLTEIANGSGVKPQQVILMVLLLSIKKPNPFLQMRVYRILKKKFRTCVLVKVRREIKSVPNMEEEK